MINQQNNQFYDEAVDANQAYFHMQEQPFGIRGVKPESNINLQTDQALLESKKDKCIEIFRTSTQIHEILTKARVDPNLNPQFKGSMDANSMIGVMFSDRHFVNGIIIYL